MVLTELEEASVGERASRKRESGCLWNELGEKDMKFGELLYKSREY